MINEIRQNAKNYRRRVFGRDGSIRISHDQTSNKIFDSRQLPSLSIPELQELGYILMHMSKDENYNAVIENDHIEYWAFVNYVVLCEYRLDYWTRNHNPLFSFIDSNLINKLKPRYNDSINKIFHNALLDELNSHNFFPAVWAGFAYLEGLCRRICSTYVETDGIVKRPFKVCSMQYRSNAGNKRAKKGRKGKSQINNLGHILELTRRLMKKDTQYTLKKFLKDFSSETIFDWRNDSLHGSEDRSTTIIVLYSLIAILLLDSIQRVSET